MALLHDFLLLRHCVLQRPQLCFLLTNFPPFLKTARLAIITHSKAGNNNTQQRGTTIILPLCNLIYDMTTYDNCTRKCIILFYKKWQKLHTTAPTLFTQTPFQLLLKHPINCNCCFFTIASVSIARYSIRQLNEPEQCTVNETVAGSWIPVLLIDSTVL